MTGTEAERAAFLRAILAEPTDDVVRLVYADWLDEHGEPDYAEFIRVQIELVRCGPCPATVFTLDELDPPGHSFRRGGEPLVEPKEPYGWCPVCVLRRLERELFAVGHIEWFHSPGVAAVLHERQAAGVAASVLVVRRGFAEALVTTLARHVGDPCGRCGGTGANHPVLALQDPDCPGCAAVLFAAHPVTVVRLTDREPYHNGSGFCWFDSARERPSPEVSPVAELPTDLYDAVTDYDSGAGSIRWKSFCTPAAAHAALSAACVLYGRRAAGLGAAVG